jgi:hypothetical protein
LAVEVKRGIGALWSNTDGPPYTTLFHAGTTTTIVWRAVLIMRVVDEELARQRKPDQPIVYMAAVHLNRVVLHVVFQDPEVRQFKSEQAEEGVLLTQARAATQRIFPRLLEYLTKFHSGEYLKSLSKNRPKCMRLVSDLGAPPSSNQGILGI